MGRQPREWLVLNLLQDGWDDTNTFGLTPDISFGWWDDAKSQPQVTVRMPDEGPTGGGTTGYDAIDPTGGTPHQTIDGVINIHCWASDRDLGSASTNHARQYLSGDESGSNHGVTEEITDILQDNASRPTDPSTGNQPVRHLAPGPVIEAPEDDAGDEVVHFVVEAQYAFGRN